MRLERSRPSTMILRACRHNGFTLMEMLVVLALAGLILAVAAPRLSAFFESPEDREFKRIEQFVMAAGRTAIRQPLVPLDRPDARPLRIKIIPPGTMSLLRADTEIGSIELAVFHIEGVVENGRPTVLEPEFDFNAFGVVSPFVMRLSAASPEDKRFWRTDRLGGIRVDKSE